MFWQIFCAGVCHKRYNHRTWDSAKFLDPVQYKSVLYEIQRISRLEIWYQPLTKIKVSFFFNFVGSSCNPMWFYLIYVRIGFNKKGDGIISHLLSSLFRILTLFIKYARWGGEIIARGGYWVWLHFTLTSGVHCLCIVVLTCPKTDSLFNK